MIYDKSKYRKIDWKHFMMFHWIINPGLMINELILGQRVPKVMLQERSREKPWIERFKVPCPHCETIHDGRTWSTHNNTGFKNWFGLYCPTCGGIIPCLWNIGSLVLLIATAPVWYGFKDRWRKNWLAKQPARFSNLDLSSPRRFKYDWVLQGMIWGFLMFLLNDITELANESVNLKKLAAGFVWWIFWGVFGFGWVMHLMTKTIIKKRAS